jgi:hypothetical protein
LGVTIEAVLELWNVKYPKVPESGARIRFFANKDWIGAATSAFSLNLAPVRTSKIQSLLIEGPKIKLGSKEGQPAVEVRIFTE